MRLSALFEEFTQYLKVERGASHRSIDTYRRYFTYFVRFTKDPHEAGGSFYEGPVVKSHRLSRVRYFPMFVLRIQFTLLLLLEKVLATTPRRVRPSTSPAGVTSPGVPPFPNDLAGRRSCGKDEQVGRVCVGRGSRLDNLLSVLTVSQAPDAAFAECAGHPAEASALPLSKRSR
jgi:hypothetical protein